MSGNLSTTLIISGVILVVGITFLLVFLPMLIRTETKLWLGDGIFRIDAASTQIARKNGLSSKSELAADQALLMVFPKEDKWGIWMKDMNFPIDIVWLNKEKKVVYIKKSAPFDDQTTIYKPEKPALYVVELPAGTTTKKSIAIGEIAIFQADGEVVN
jgi:uncharacterized membrane protein (UPF0127 family)